MMKDTKKNRDVHVPHLDPEASERIFSRITEELEISPREKKQRRNYRMEATIRYAVPRILALLVLMAVLVALMAALSVPAAVKDLEREHIKAGSERVRFSVTRPLAVSQIEAKINGRSLYVGPLEGGFYVDVPENGTLELSIESVMGSVWTESLTIDDIDKEAPHVSRYETEDGLIRIYLTDGEDGSGIDWAGITASVSDSGQPYPVDGYDPEEGYVVFAMPDSAILIQVPDEQGNMLAATLNPKK